MTLVEKMEKEVQSYAKVYRNETELRCRYHGKEIIKQASTMEKPASTVKPNSCPVKLKLFVVPMVGLSLMKNIGR